MKRKILLLFLLGAMMYGCTSNNSPPKVTTAEDSTTSDINSTSDTEEIKTDDNGRQFADYGGDLVKEFDGDSDVINNDPLTERELKWEAEHPEYTKLVRFVYIKTEGYKHPLEIEELSIDGDKGYAYYLKSLEIVFLEDLEYPSLFFGLYDKNGILLTVAEVKNWTSHVKAEEVNVEVMSASIKEEELGDYEPYEFRYIGARYRFIYEDMHQKYKEAYFREVDMQYERPFDNGTKLMDTWGTAIIDRERYE